ncbi:MAG TPA: prepilin-type N-terminal cleavage/methylation domain-containing protein [Lacunisphaera sp.]|nr:prepilin-type N-terminal cleavage/methylation domain-containing protein [Lacunisphaera sp.]
MKTRRPSPLRSRTGFTLVEILISLSITVLAMGLTLGTFLFGLRTMYKDTQRLATNASLRSFMAQISKETLDASYFYLFQYYTKLDGNVDLSADPLVPALTIDDPGTDYDKYTAHGDCLVLVTNTSLSSTTKIRQVRVYYRLTTSQATMNAEAPLRYYETTDWGTTGDVDGSGNAVSLTTILNSIDLKDYPTIAGSKLISSRTKGRAVPSPYTGYTAGDLYPVFSSESPNANATNGYISINVEFINGSTVNSMLSSSSFNYTISPRR